MADAVARAEVTRTTSVLVMLAHIVCFFEALSYHPPRIIIGIVFLWNRARTGIYHMFYNYF